MSCVISEVTSPSLNPGKPAVTGLQYFLYRKVTYWLAVDGWPSTTPQAWLRIY